MTPLQAAMQENDLLKRAYLAFRAKAGFTAKASGDLVALMAADAESVKTDAEAPLPEDAIGAAQSIARVPRRAHGHPGYNNATTQFCSQHLATLASQLNHIERGGKDLLQHVFIDGEATPVMVKFDEASLTISLTTDTPDTVALKLTRDQLDGLEVAIGFAKAKLP